MARLFTTGREIDFFNDIAKELSKDVNAQKIYYYNLSIEKSNVHGIYDEATQKIFEQPIEIECWVSWNPQEQKINKYGHQANSTITVYVQPRDLIEREIAPKPGDVISHGDTFFEIKTAKEEAVIHGQVEYNSSFMIEGVQVRKEVFTSNIIGPTNEKYTDEDAVQEVFTQQRGRGESDKRALIENGILEQPVITQPAEVSKKEPAGNKPRSGFFSVD